MNAWTTRSLLTLVAGLLTTAAPAAETGKTPDGKAIFLAQKCNTCHAVSSAAIEPAGKIKAPDLTDKAAKTDAAELGKYLRKEVPIRDKKHVKAFTGSDEELGALIAWLQKQNPQEK